MAGSILLKYGDAISLVFFKVLITHGTDVIQMSPNLEIGRLYGSAKCIDIFISKTS